MEVFSDKKTSKYTNKYSCELCDFVCSKKGDWIRHSRRAKHVNLTQSNDFVTEKTSTHNYICNTCNKIYISRNGLWNHKKKCADQSTTMCSIATESENQPTTNNQVICSITTELVMELIKDNKELKQMLLEQNNTINNLVKKGIVTNNTNINSLYNNNNKTFNLQFFLNETCKDAMNIMDFVESIKLQLSDLEKVGELGYVEGISNIITTKLKALDVSQRPVHCTDKKREVMYIKDEDKWSKEDDSKTKLRDVIKTISNNNIRLLPLFRAKNPEYSNSSSRVSDKYEKIVIAAMGCDGNADIDKEDKILRNISKTVIVEKCD